MAARRERKVVSVLFAATQSARPALAFYESVGARRFVERLEAVLPVSA